MAEATHSRESNRWDKLELPARLWQANANWTVTWGVWICMCIFWDAMLIETARWQSSRMVRVVQRVHSAAV